MAARPAPRVSIGLPVYNGEKFLGRAISSVLGQSWTDLELVVSDNGSDDGSLDIARQAAMEDPRVRVLTSGHNRGAAWNFNRVLGASRGEYFKWHAYDDLMDARLVSSCVEALDAAAPDTVLAYPRTALIDDEDAVLDEYHDDLHLAEPRPSERLQHLLGRATEYHPVFGLMRRTTVLQTRGILAFPLSDINLLVEMCLRGKFVELPDPLFQRRFHAATSLKANPSAAQLAKWFDPTRSGRVLPVTRLTRAMLGSVRRAPISAAEQLACSRHIAVTWAAPRWRVIGGEVRRAVVGPRG